MVPKPPTGKGGLPTPFCRIPASAAQEAGRVPSSGARASFHAGRFCSARFSRSRALLTATVFALWACWTTRAAAASDPVWTVLESRCFSCHGPEKQKAGLRLDRREAVLRGGDSGAAVRPGEPAAQSLLYRVVSGLDPAIQMPPTKSGPALSPKELQLLASWIESGASWDRAPVHLRPSAGSMPTPHWAFVPPERPAMPAVSGRWARNAVDHFVLARLEQAGAQPSKEADRATLLRRVTLDLTGLPPTARELEDFLGERGPMAYERVVDRLLESPHYGERWGRHWLDLARYADSDGYEKDSVRPTAYTFRDWVIRALNEDMPFDRFTLLQLAGDLEPGTDVGERVATGFHRQTLTNKEGGVDPEEFRCKATADRANTTATTWLGLTFGCAECHNHKYDPITQHEYYQFYAFFNEADEADADAARFILGRRAGTNSLIAPVMKPRSDRPTYVHVRGDFLRRGERVEPGTPAALNPMRPRETRADRLDLARWLFDPGNPLTARVAVNRVWKHLFGRGLVHTTEDFGTRGERPSHPQLLDWLATEFRRMGWSQKQLIRLVVTSATYRQSSEWRSDLEDPANLLLARQGRLRLEAEVIRDQALMVSGLLARRVGGPSVRPPMPADIAAIGYANAVKWEESRGEDRYRRGVYILFQRTVPYPMLLAFDAPDSNAVCTRRERSNTPIQALTLLNDPVFVECAERLGALVAHPGAGIEERVRALFRTALGRNPASEELARLVSLHRQVEHHEERRDVVHGPGRAPAAAAGLAVARAVMNLDEWVTRE